MITNALKAFVDGMCDTNDGQVCGDCHRTTYAWIDGLNALVVAGQTQEENLQKMIEIAQPISSPPRSLHPSNVNLPTLKESLERALMLLEDANQEDATWQAVLLARLREIAQIYGNLYRGEISES